MTFVKKDNSISLAWTGASGVAYGIRLLECLLRADYQVFLMVSSAARVVLATEYQLPVNCNDDIQLKQQLLKSIFADEQLKSEQPKGELHLLGSDEWLSPPASGSGAPKQMVICPCSTGTLAAVATGMSSNLLERAADVVLKEQNQLILVPRETPLSSIHLEHMLSLSKLGVTIMPAAPGFYHDPKSVQDLVDFMVARILDHLGIEQQLTTGWGYSSSNE